MVEPRRGKFQLVPPTWNWAADRAAPIISVLLATGLAWGIEYWLCQELPVALRALWTMSAAICAACLPWSWSERANWLLESIAVSLLTLTPIVLAAMCPWWPGLPATIPFLTAALLLTAAAWWFADGHSTGAAASCAAAGAGCVAHRFIMLPQPSPSAVRVVAALVCAACAVIAGSLFLARRRRLTGVAGIIACSFWLGGAALLAGGSLWLAGPAALALVCAAAVVKWGRAPAVVFAIAGAIGQAAALLDAAAPAAKYRWLVAPPWPAPLAVAALVTVAAAALAAWPSLYRRLPAGTGWAAAPLLPAAALLAAALSQPPVHWDKPNIRLDKDHPLAVIDVNVPRPVSRMKLVTELRQAWGLKPGMPVITAILRHGADTRQVTLRAQEDLAEWSIENPRVAGEMGHGPAALDSWHAEYAMNGRIIFRACNFASLRDFPPFEPTSLELRWQVHPSFATSCKVLEIVFQ